MTKPSNFILNSDYLALAQTSSSEFTITFPPATVQGGFPYDNTINVAVPSSPGAIDSYLVSLDNGDYHLGSVIVISSSPHTIQINIYRLDANTIQARLHVYTASSSGYNLPSHTLKVKLTSFAPPNLF